MNIIEENFQNKEEKKKNKITGIILACIVILIISIIAIVIYLAKIKKSQLKVFVDGKQNENVKSIISIEEDGTVYAPIKDIASFFGYEAYNGEYTEKSEKENKCYVECENEVANFTINSSKISKLDLTKNSTNYEYYTFNNKRPVKSSDGKLYATSEMISTAFNVSFIYNQDTNQINIFTLPYLVEYYNKLALQEGYEQISENFANRKAILDELLVVERKDGKELGVLDLEGKKILEPKYSEITYIPEAKDFLVGYNNKYGIISKNKETKLQTTYDSIDLINGDAELYVVKTNNKYGIYDLKGKKKIDVEYDEIGIDINKFQENGITNKYFIGEELIPVRKDTLWGFFDKQGNKIVDFKYDSIGCIASNNKDAKNLLVIPDYDVIVVCKDKKYSLINSEGEELFPIVADDIYMEISEGKKAYYIGVNNQRMNAIEFLEGLNGKKSEKATEDKQNNQKQSSEQENKEQKSNDQQDNNQQQDNNEE